MKTSSRFFFVAGILFFFTFLHILSQAPQAFNYQAVVRDGEGNPLSEENVTLRLSLVSDPESSSVIYSETHSVTTNSFGLVNLNVGEGTVAEGDFTSAEWANTSVYLKVEMDLLDGNGYSDMGVSRILSVPYALYAASGTEGPPGPQGPPGAGLTGRGNWVDGETYQPNDFVFDRSGDDPDVNSMWIVQASEEFVSTTPPYNDPDNWIEFQAPQGEPGILAEGESAGNTPYWDGSEWVINSSNLYNNGANIGIGTTSPSEKLDVDGTVRLRGHLFDSGNSSGTTGQVLGRRATGVIWQDPSVKGSGNAGNLAYWNDGSTLGSMPYILYGDDESVKISSRDDAGDDDPIFEVKNRTGQVVFGVYQTGVRIYVDDADDTGELKGTRAGFAVGGFSQSKQGEVEYLRVDPGSVRISIDDTTKVDGVKGTRGGFAVGGFTTQKQTAYDYFNLTPGSAEFWLDESEQAKGSRGGFAVGGFTSEKTTPDNYLDLTPENYFIGHLSGSSNDGGIYNSFMGFETGKSNIDGSYNLFLGYQAGILNTHGNSNSFVGSQAGASNTSGDYNAFLGQEAGFGNGTGNYNTFMGYQAGYNSGGSSYNTSIGYMAGYSLNDWQGGAFVGFEAGKNITGRGNTALGSSAGSNASTGEYNVLIGSLAGTTNNATLNSGSRNVYIGRTAGFFFGEATNNVAVGYNAGSSATGDGNVFLGYNAGAGTSADSRLYISNPDGTLIYGEFDTKRVGIDVSSPTATLDVNGSARFRKVGSGAYSQSLNITSDGTLTTASSDIRMKENISTLSNSLDDVLKLRGVSFTWKDQPALGKRIGFIAQEVEPVLPELVFVNEEDGYLGVNYPEMTAVLVEAIKEQQQQIEDLTGHLRATEERLEQLHFRLDQPEQMHLLHEQQEQIMMLREENEFLKEQINEIMNMLSDEKTD
ncbi:MAG: tail fiber domain-containing protein [Bacteroidales bacterium]